MSKPPVMCGVSLSILLCALPALAETAKSVAAEFQNAKNPEARADLFARTIARGPAAAKLIKPHIDAQVRTLDRKYTQRLTGTIRGAYLKHLTTLTDEQIHQVQKTRRLWKHYLLTTASQHDFQKTFLRPCAEMAATLLLKMEDVNDEPVASQRRLLVEFGDYYSRCNAALGIDPDRAKTKKSPTGIPYPHLDRPQLFQDYLSYLERTLVLVHSIAPKGAARVLMEDLKHSREIDVEEAEFVLFGNEVRMLTGTIAWRVDPVVCACARDHSADRKAGKAKGHWSSIPEKKSFGMRLKRFGASGRSEGAGGGRSGRGYIHGLSYGGGHTGPLYSLKRNVVGVGRRGGVYTSIYRTERRIVHPCAVTSGELFMPPGLTRADVKASALQQIYNNLRHGLFRNAHWLAKNARVKSDLDKTLLRFFTAAVQVELDWFFEAVALLEEVGDVCELKRRVEAAKTSFREMPAFRERIKPVEQRLSQADAAKEIKLGGLYRTISTASPNTALLKEFVQRYKDSVYAAAAGHVLAATKGTPHPLSYFVSKNASLRRYEYPPATRR